MALGEFSPRRFLALNIVGAGIWAAVVSTLGYVFGEAAEAMLPHTRHYQLVGLVAVIFAVAVFMIVRRVKTS
jgi:membrane protein DedA with SNARE-associated domain